MRIGADGFTGDPDLDWARAKLEEGVLVRMLEAFRERCALEVSGAVAASDVLDLRDVVVIRIRGIDVRAWLAAEWDEPAGARR